ncbi:MAG: hypothetical protein ACSHWT_13845 [Glaciecola sp.]
MVSQEYLQDGRPITLNLILQLHETTKVQIREITHSQHAAQLIDGIFDRPIFKASDFSTRTRINKQTLHGLLRALTSNDGPLIILKEGQGRRATYCCIVTGVCTMADGTFR